jgi:long-chain acyl-CoA synthetase
MTADRCPPLWELVRRDRDAEAVRDALVSLSWAELDRRTTAVGNGLDALGLAPGAHVTLACTNRVDFVAALLGVQRAGMCVTPVKTSWTAEEIGYVLGDAGSGAVITDVPAGRVAGSTAGVAVIDLDDDLDAWMTAQSADPLPLDRRGSRMSYTSGTTGRPKGVVRASDTTRPFAEAFPASARWTQVLGLDTSVPHLAVAQLFHGAPLTFGLAALAAGAPLWILDRWDPAACLDGLSAGAGTTIVVPSMFRELLALPAEVRAAADVSGVRTLVHGGEPCPPGLKRRMIDWFGPVLVEYYGFTEGGMTVADTEEWESRPGTVGRPSPPLRILVLDDDGRELPPGEVGTVYASTGSARPFAYRNDPAKTDAVYRGDAFTAGDVGWVDEDGYLFLCGRAADVIVAAGVNVYPAEIEAVLDRVTEIAEAGVVAGPHPVRGEQPVAFVVPGPGIGADQARAAVDAAVADLARYKRPREVHVVATLPRDATGKLLRRHLQDPLWDGIERFAAAGPGEVKELRHATE